MELHALTLAACPCALLDAERSYYGPEFVLLQVYNHKQQCQRQHFCFVFSMALYCGDNNELSMALHVQTLPQLKGVCINERQNPNVVWSQKFAHNYTRNYFALRYG